MADSYNELYGLGSHSEDANMEGWWLLQDDAASTAVDDQSSNADDAVLQGGNTTSQLSSPGPNSYLTKAFDFDGTSDYADGIRSISFGTGAFTLLASFNPDVLTFRIILGKDVSGQRDWNYGVGAFTSGRLYFGSTVVGTSKHIEGDTALSAGTWYRGVVARDGSSNMSMYLNGSTESFSFVGGTSAPFNANFAATNGIHIAQREFGGFNQRWNGDLCGLAIFSRELTAAEVAQDNAGPEPVNTVTPSAPSGTLQVGQTLTADTGTWALPSPFSAGSNGTVTYTYQWYRADDTMGTNEAAISGATSSTYVLTSGDVTKYIRVLIAASNTGGNDSAADTYSSYTGQVVAAATPEHGVSFRGNRIARFDGGRVVYFKGNRIVNYHGD